MERATLSFFPCCKGGIVYYHHYLLINVRSIIFINKHFMLIDFFMTLGEGRVFGVKFLNRAGIRNFLELYYVSLYDFNINLVLLSGLVLPVTYTHFIFEFRSLLVPPYYLRMELILTNLNGFGKYQKSILFLIGLVSMLCAFFNFAPVFTTAQPKLTCKYQANGTELPNNNCEAWRALQNNPELNSSYTCEFNSQFYGRTIVSEWGLYCDRLYLASSVTTLYMIGQIFSFIGGWIGDKFGRRVICILSLAGVCLSATISEVVISKFSLDWYTQYVVYSIGQFFLGFWSKLIFSFRGFVRFRNITYSNISIHNKG